MRKVINIGGGLVCAVLYGLCIWGLATTPDAHAVPTPDRLVIYGVVGMMACAIVLVLVFAKGAQVGDQ